MRYAFFIIPKVRRLAATLHAVENLIRFEAHIWRKGVKDPDFEDWDHGVELCDPADALTTTHLMLWGFVNPAQREKLRDFAQDIPGARFRLQDRGWTRWTAMEDMGLIEKPQPLEEWEL